MSVDDSLRRIGIPIVSRCDCCEVGKYEDQNHVLFGGEFATNIWCYCGNIFGLPLGHTWMETVTAWLRRASTDSQVGILVGYFRRLLVGIFGVEDALPIWRGGFNLLVWFGK